jgi:hypothetical protein
MFQANDKKNTNHVVTNVFQSVANNGDSHVHQIWWCNFKDLTAELLTVLVDFLYRKKRKRVKVQSKCANCFGRVRRSRRTATFREFIHTNFTVIKRKRQQTRHEMFRLLLLPRRECEGTGREWRWTSWMDIITVCWLDKSGKNLLNLNLTCSQGFLKSVGHLKNEEKVLQVKSNSSSYRDRKWTYISVHGQMVGRPIPPPDRKSKMREQPSDGPGA